MPRPRGKFFQADAYVRGYPRVRAGGFPTYQAAEAWEIQARAAIVAGTRLPKAPSSHTPISAGPTVEDLFEHCKKFAWAEIADRSHAMQQGRYFVDWIGPDTLASTVNAPKMVEYVEHLMEFDINNNTINHYLSAVSKMWKEGDLKWATGLFTIPWRKVGKGRKRKITRDEEAEILRISIKHGLPHFARWASWLADSGMRPSETFRIRREHGTILPSGTLQLEVQGTKTITSRRVIGLSERCKEIFERPEWDGGDVLFDFKRSDVRKWWLLVRREMGLEDDVEFVIYAFRHASVSRQLALGIDHHRVKLFHGHSSIKTTEGYAHLSTEALNEMVDVVSKGVASNAKA